jgi:hypothetical protein
VFDWGRANRMDSVFGLAPNAALSRHVAALEKSTAERFTAAPTHRKRRRFSKFIMPLRAGAGSSASSPESMPA